MFHRQVPALWPYIFARSPVAGTPAATNVIRAPSQVRRAEEGCSRPNTGGLRRRLPAMPGKSLYPSPGDQSSVVTGDLSNR